MMKPFFLSMFLGAALSSPLLSADFVPRFGEATLRSETGEFRRVRIQSPWHDQHRVGERRFALDGDTVVEISAAGDRELRRIRSPKQMNLLWLATTDVVACFATDCKVEKSWVDDLAPPVVERLDLKTMQWLQPLTIKAAKSIPRRERKQANKQLPQQPVNVQPTTILSAGVACHRNVVLLLYEARLCTAPPAAGDYSCVVVDGYQVVCLDPQSGKTTWSALVPWNSDDPLPDEAVTVLHAPRQTPRFRENRIRLLNLLDYNVRDEPHDVSKLLVCAGKRQPLVCFGAETGKECWRMDRIWEYDRSYFANSPDVEFTRFGITSFDQDVADGTITLNEPNEAARKLQIEESKKTCDNARKAFYEKCDSWIAAGPIVTTDFRSQFFVAVARGRRASDNAVIDPLIYEIEPEGGEIQTMTSVPRNVIGRPCKAFDDTVVWACESDSFVRVASWSSPNSKGQNNGGLTCIEWYREIPIPGRTGGEWLNADPDRDAACLTDRWLFRAGKAYVAKKEERLYRFQIGTVDVITGIKGADLTLTIPFDGDLPKPRYGTFGGDSAWTDSPHVLGISDLQVEGSILRVITKRSEPAGGESKIDYPRTALEFDIGSLGQCRPGSQERSEKQKHGIDLGDPFAGNRRG